MAATSNQALVVFFALAYAWAWAVYIPMVIFHAPLPWTVAATLGPTVAAVAAQRWTAGNYRAFRVRAAPWRLLGATAAGVALMLLAYVILPALTAVEPRKLHWRVLVSLGVFNYSTLLGGPLFEEPGWRGFALPRLEERFGPVPGSLMLGLLWAGWHLPLFFYAGWTSAPLWIYVLIVVGAAFLLTYGTNLARFSVVTPIAMHAVFNTSARYFNGLFADTNPRFQIPFELVLALCGLAIAAVLVVSTRGQLGFHGK